jgi:LacI family transcriptional regulator
MSRDAGDGTGGEVARTSRRTPRATIHDVARLAGVTIGTASKALNGGGNLRADTRERVRKAAKNLDYRPNDLAQSLHRKQSFTVGMLSNDSFGRFTLPIFEALEGQLADHGIAVFMCNATDDPARERQHLDQLLGKQVDGLVITARRADRLEALAQDLDGATWSVIDDRDGLAHRQTEDIVEEPEGTFWIGTAQ